MSNPDVQHIFSHCHEEPNPLLLRRLQHQPVDGDGLKLITLGVIPPIAATRALARGE